LEVAVKPLLVQALRSGPGTCTEITDRLRSYGRIATELEVHRALRRMVDTGEVIDWTSIARKHMRSDRAPEGLTVNYELASLEVVNG
jgi:hypothetical protein